VLTDLEPVDESWTTALCVVAHPDDLEFGTAAAIARWTDQGKTVVYAMVTSGEAGIDGMDPAEARRVREAEQLESAKIVGVHTVEFSRAARRSARVRTPIAASDLPGRTAAST
jgi:LmbE family N-acetylglucosaminyl deacetylase